MSSNSSPGVPSGDPHPYSYDSAVEPPRPEPQRELNPDEIAAASAWAATLDPDSPEQTDPYSAYADPYGQPYATPPYPPPAGSTPYADAYGPIPGQRPMAGPYVQTNPYAVVPAQPYGYTPYGQPLVNHPQAAPAMIVSIISWFLCPILGAVGMFMGIGSVNAINREPHRYTGKGMAITGIVMGAISSVGSLFFLFLVMMGGIMG